MLNNNAEIRLCINGFEIKAAFSNELIENVLIPLLAKLTAMQQRRNRRIIVFLAGPPGCGKSTLAAFLQELSMRLDGLEPLQAVGIDGFHYPQEYVLTHTVYRDGCEIPMRDVKGCPESFDAEKLHDAIQIARKRDTLWPFYDRRLHDVVEGAIDVNRNILLVEGNWLLLDEGIWASMRSLCDFSIRLHAEADALKDRLVARKMKGGLPSHSAVAFYETSDRPNIERCLANSADADMTVQLDRDWKRA